MVPDLHGVLNSFLDRYLLLDLHVVLDNWKHIVLFSLKYCPLNDEVCFSFQKRFYPWYSIVVYKFCFTSKKKINLNFYRNLKSLQPHLVWEVMHFLYDTVFWISLFLCDVHTRSNNVSFIKLDFISKHRNRSIFETVDHKAGDTGFEPFFW